MKTIVVIIGVTGDLSRRKLLPALDTIASHGKHDLQIIGITRSKERSPEVLSQVRQRHAHIHGVFSMYEMNAARQADYLRLKEYLAALMPVKQDAQILFYLSVPPSLSRGIVRELGSAGFADMGVKLLLEKPFGTDFESASELVHETQRYFKESQIYRIDHYLAKEMAQNIIVFRQDNSLLRHTWNNDFIERIEIVASEKIGIEGRAEFYEQTGALRDLVQSHLLQLAALVLMRLPEKTLREVPKHRYDALAHLIVSDFSLIHRGQYSGYKSEVNAPHSTTETYVDITLRSTDKGWSGVPIRIITGKAMHEKKTYIRIVYKKDRAHEANELTILLQPSERIELSMWAKVPGYEHKLENHMLSFALADHFTVLPEAYEQVLVSAIRGDHVLFARSDEILETWRIVDAIRKHWDMSGDGPFYYTRNSEDIEKLY